MLQQGDVNIVRLEGGFITEKKSKIKNGAIREGEATGHAHKIVGTDFELFQFGGRILARIISGDCQVVHEEHKPVDLPVGEYEFLPVNEYDHFAERSRFVRD